MPLLSGTSRAVIAENIAELRRSGYPEAQAVAIAFRKAGRSRRVAARRGDASRRARTPERTAAR